MPSPYFKYLLSCAVFVMLASSVTHAVGSLQIKSPDGGEIRSLLIGINAYQHVRPLKGAVADARDVENSLRAMGVNDMEVLIDSEASREHIIQAISNLLLRTGKNDLVVLSIAGHGAQEPEKLKGSEPDGMENVFLLAGFEPTAQGSRQRILGSEFKHFIKQFELRGAKVLFVADTCHGGGMTRSVDPRAEDMIFRQVPTYVLSEDTLKPIRDDQNILSDADFDRTTFLAAVDRNTKAPEVRIPGIEGYRGALSYAVARAFEGSADENRDGRVTLKELFANVRQVVYQLSEQRQNIVTTASPNLIAGSDTVYQFTRDGGPLVRESQKPSDSNLVASATVSLDSKKQSLPVRLAALDGKNGYFSDIRPRDATIEVVLPVDNPDLIWDPQSHDVIAWGDVVAYDIAPADIATVVDRTAAVRELKKFSTKAPQTLQLIGGDNRHSTDDVVQISLSDVANRSIVLVNLSSDGTVQMLYPFEPDTPHNSEADFRLSLRVRRPFGADQIIAVTSSASLSAFERAVSSLNRTRAPGALVKSLFRFLPADARIGSIGIFTAP